MKYRLSDDLVEVGITLGFVCIFAVSYVIMGFTVTAGVVSAAVVHELAHAVASELCGAKVRCLRLSLFGAEMVSENALLSYPKEIVCIAAGPLSNFVYGAAISVFSSNETAMVFAGINISVAVFNLIPATGFDGGRILALCSPKAASVTSAVMFCIMSAATIFFTFTAFSGMTLFILTLYIPGIILYYITRDKMRRYSYGQKNRRNTPSRTKACKIYRRGVRQRDEK